MRTRTGSNGSADKHVKEIKRRTRRKFAAEEKIRIVLDGLRGESSISELCRREGIAESLYYSWSKEFMVAGFTYGNGHVFSQVLTPRQMPARLRVVKGSTVALDQQYIYTLRDQVGTMTDLAVSGNNRSYAYDPAGRVVSASGPWGSGSYTYDALNNLTNYTQGSRTVTNSYNSLLRLTSSADSANGTRSLSYDSRGNVTALGGQNFVYDAANQPRLLTGAVSGSYTYDGHKRRVKAIADGETIYNVFDVTGKLLMVDNDSTSEQTAYVHMDHMLIARVDGAGTVTYQHTDLIGSPVAGTLASGAVDWREKYTPYGEKMDDPAGLRNQASFTGHIDDHATGLTYMQARYYDPALGRFLSRDPVKFHDKMEPSYFNNYAYVANDPLNATDPTGKYCVTTNGTVNCDHPDSDVPNVSFPAPSGWPDYIGSSHARSVEALTYHDYDHEIPFSVGGEAARQIGIDRATENPTPGSGDAPATAGGTWNDVERIALQGHNPVESYLLPRPGGAEGEMMIVNVTLPGHEVWPGYIVQFFDVGDDGFVTAHVAGEGNGPTQSNLNPFARPMERRVWREQVRQYRDNDPN